MSQQTLVDAERLRAEVREKYRAVAVEPAARYHFHTGRGLAARLGYDAAVVDALPQVAVESFAGVANPLALRTPAPASGWSTSARAPASTLSWPPPTSAPGAESWAST